MNVIRSSGDAVSETDQLSKEDQFSEEAWEEVYVSCSCGLQCCTKWEPPLIQQLCALMK